MQNWTAGGPTIELCTCRQSNIKICIHCFRTHAHRSVGHPGRWFVVVLVVAAVDSMRPPRPKQNSNCNCLRGRMPASSSMLCQFEYVCCVREIVIERAPVATKKSEYHFSSVWASVASARVSPPITFTSAAHAQTRPSQARLMSTAVISSCFAWWLFNCCIQIGQIYGFLLDARVHTHAKRTQLPKKQFAQQTASRCACIKS